MFGSVRSRAAVAAVACGVLAGPVAVAHASNASIVSTFLAANGHLNHDNARLAQATKAFRKHKTGVRPVIAALRHESGDIRAVNRRIKGEHASTAKGRRGKAGITKGLTLIADAYSRSANVLQRALAGHPATRRQVRAINAERLRGRKKLIAGLRLLGIRVVR